MTIFDVKKALISKMKTLFSDDEFNYYSKEVTEGYERPAFFTTLKPISVEPLNYNSQNNQYCFYIDYVQKTEDEADALNVAQKIKDLFGLFVKVGNRAVNVTGFNFDFIGKTKDQLEVAVDLQWIDRIKHNTEDVPNMQEVQTTIKN